VTDSTSAGTVIPESPLNVREFPIPRSSIRAAPVAWRPLNVPVVHGKCTAALELADGTLLVGGELHIGDANMSAPRVRIDREGGWRPCPWGVGGRGDALALVECPGLLATSQPIADSYRRTGRVQRFCPAGRRLWRIDTNGPIHNMRATTTRMW